MSENSKKVLIIDDNLTLVQTLGMILEIKGFDISTANDGITGLNKIKAELPDIVICDLMMPGMDGMQVCINAKSDLQTKDIPIIFLSGKDTGESMYRAMDPDKKADWYIQKPYNIDHLMSVFDKLLK
jgi:DNA-binding response OmpR family regulator